MDSYPEDLLVGVFPLVFAVDAIARSTDNNSPRRTLFDRFLDAVAASLVEDEPERKTNNLSLFRNEEDAGHDALEEFAFGQTPGFRRSSSLSANMYPGFNSGFGRSKSFTRVANPESTDSSTVSAFAKSLGNGQNFFQQARIEPIGLKHGLPPSKDPDGEDSTARHLRDAVKTRSVASLQQLFEAHPIGGILPAGWLEKHVHALPSVILVVCEVSADRTNQEVQDKRLFETIEHLRQSLVPKRKCKIQIIGLLQDDITTNQGDIWSRAVAAEFVEGDGLQSATEQMVTVTLLRASTDLQASDTGMPTSPALKRLHRNIRDASLSYYLTQASRVKDKLSMMLSLMPGREFSTPPVQLLPLVIRYCFKISMFYEFQWKHEKSLLYMSEAYRHVCRYYQYIVALQTDAGEIDDASDDEHFGAEAFSGEGDGVEVSLANPASSISWRKVVSSPPSDMIHQCRIVAEWMNLKILSAAFSSRSEAGLLAASCQWRDHSRVFCSSKPLPSSSVPSWHQWAYITRQRLVMSQLMERHPPNITSLDGKESRDVIERCSLWRTYASISESMLRLNRELSLCDGIDGVAEDDGDKMRPQFVGGIGSKGLGSDLVESKSVNHRETALEMITRSITLYEEELEREKRGFYAEDSFRESSSSREGARMYYLSGGILLGMGRHEEAAARLSKAAKFVSGWNSLQLAIRRMLIECYEKHIPTQGASTESDTLASMILDSYFNAEMSSQELRKALGHFLSLSGGESLKWFHKTVDDEDSSLPFSFAVSFPWKTQTVAGDTVRASVLIRSNLDYAVHVNSAVLLSLAGDLPIPSNDLRSATNVSEGSDGGVIIQAKTAIIVSTEVALPRDTSLIASDDSGNGGEQLGVAGKGSFAKSARPRSAGITAAGGARFLPELASGDRSQQSQGWNLKFLGGKPLRCDGLKLVFYPVQATRSMSEKESLALIELTIKKEKPRTAANIKRTPFEEENYIASAWTRPAYLPLSRGPRSLRVSGPIPHMVVTNPTDTLTAGKAVEGTVNRTILKLQAGEGEVCTNVKVSISCFSVLVTPSGSTKRLVAATEITAETENSLDMSKEPYRTPALVCKGESSTDAPLGYRTPSGWSMPGTGQKMEELSVQSLRAGESTFIHFDLYRPASEMETELEPTEALISEKLADWSVCKTDFYVTISYRQERPSAKKMRPPTRGSRRQLRRPPSMSGTTKEPKESDPSSTQQGPTPDATQPTTDDVTLEHTGSVVWTTPLAASFSRGVGNKCPSGSRHPSNSLDKDPLFSDTEFALVDGERVTSVCNLKLDSAMEGLTADIVSVGFKPGSEEDSQTDLVAFSGEKGERGSSILCKPKTDDITRRLSTDDSQFSVSYVVQSNMKPSVRRGGISSHLGVIEVEWLPTPIPIPDEVRLSKPDWLETATGHGPLALESPSVVRFRGPPIYIESAPFEAKVVEMPACPSVPQPFDVRYSIRNKTNLHQPITIRMEASSSENAANLASPLEYDGLLLTGTMQDELILGPQELRTLCYTYLALKPGPVKLPALEVASKRYKSWIVHEQGRNNEIYVFP